MALEFLVKSKSPSNTSFTDTNWTKGTGWSISGGAASCDGTQTAGTQLVQNGTYTLNKT